ncbi:MAG: LacI family DNA-binding transcriptional regulator [Alphaproteobacteria bacterium]|nr:LacI family DNA-binding transcriptional regulator [Alphaproteobacteria bacterium]
MTDIANLAGCSQSTVSVVLNDTPGIVLALETRQLVLESAKKLGYIHQKNRPKLTANPHQIAVIFDQMSTSPEAMVAIDGVRDAAWPSGHIVAAYQTLNDPRMEPLTIAAASISDVKAIVYATIMTREVIIPPALFKVNKPVILLNCYSKCRSFPSILPGEMVGGQQATNQLITAGHVRIGHITGEMWMDAAKSRLRGYQHALSSADIVFDPELVRNGDWQTKSGYEETRKLLDLKSPPTAIFCANDRMAVGCFEAIKEHGLKIPENISVIGYDDEEIARQLTPPLTTLILPHREMGRWAVNTALENIDLKQLPEDLTFPLTKLECILVKRNSIAAPQG